MIFSSSCHHWVQKQNTAYRDKAFHVLLVLFISTLLSFMLQGCGYSILAKNSISSDHNGPVKIYAPQWRNFTNELGFEGVLQDSLVDRFTESGHFIITDSSINADYILHGKIFSIEHIGSSYGSYDRATGLKAKLKISYSVKSPQSDEIVLEQPVYLREETYVLGEDTVQTLSLQKQALAIIADEVAEEIYMRLLTNLTDQGQNKFDSYCPEVPDVN